jgi:hypothetical protein
MRWGYEACGELACREGWRGGGGVAGGGGLLVAGGLSSASRRCVRGAVASSMTPDCDCWDAERMWREAAQ